MRITLFIISLFLLLNPAFPQETRYQTYKAQLKINANKDGEIYKWENKNITVTLDYRTGEFLLKLKNTDFQQTEGNSTATPDDEKQQIEYQFNGILPVNDILHQKSITTTYPVELQLSCDELDINQTLNFQMEVTRPGSGSGGYRIFSLNGKLYNDELNIPAFDGFDNEVELWIVFNAFSN